VLGKIFSLNTVKHNCLIKILVTNVSHIAFLVHCRPDDGRLTTETCCLNEYNIRLPVTRILIKQLCLTVLSEYIMLFTSNEGRKMLLNLKMLLLLCCNVDN
jgi:hypothetical protein